MAKKVKTEVVKAKRAPMKPRPYIVTLTVTLCAPNKAAALEAGDWYAEHLVDYAGGTLELNKISATLKPKKKVTKAKKRTAWDTF